MATSVQTDTNLAMVADQAVSVAQMFCDRVAQTPDREAFRYLVGDRWVSRTWRETAQEVTRLAAGLVALGVTAQQRVAIASETRYEWILADLAIMCAGAATTTVYPSAISGDVAFILADSSSTVVFAENDDQIAKLREQRGALPSLRTVVTFEGTPDGDGDPWVISLDRLAELGTAYLAEHPGTVEERIAAIHPEHLATLIYTSGTTGRPKGVRLLHSSWTYEGAAVASLGVLHVDDLQYLWLPMSHAFGKVLLTTQLQVGFATAVDGRMDRIMPNLAVVRPTFMGAVPRFFEKAQGVIATRAQSAGWPKARVFDWADDVALEVSRLARQDKPVPWRLAAAHKLADRLVLVKVRELFGGRVRFFISGASALSEQIVEWFHGAGILILEGYGLTETSAGSVFNRPDRFKFGTVGLPLPGTQIMIAQDGEIMIKGPGVMDGYHHLDQDSGQTLTSDGWLATGDIGEIDADGFLRITDRKKNLFKSSGGKYIAPAQIESHFTAICPLASHILVHGDQRNYCVALIALAPDAVADWARHHDMAGLPYSQVVTSQAMRITVDDYVHTLNSQLNHWTAIKKFIILDHDLTVDSGELTPSMKVRRPVVEANYREALDALYTE
jgi:long-chain acyl-CoA synthetase